MTFSRNINKRQLRNNSEQYRHLIEKKDLNYINHYSTISNVKKNNLKENILYIKYEWKASDKFYKLAQEYYSDPSLWWIIAHFNDIPTEHEISIGQIIKIPNPSNLQETLNFLGY